MLERLAGTFFDSLVLMLVALPMIGACLVLAVSRFGVDSVRRTALSNALLTLAVSLVIASRFDATLPQQAPAGSQFQMKTELRWLAEWRPATGEPPQTDGRAPPRRRVLAGPDVRVAFGVDGVSLWFLVLTTVLMLPAVLAGRDVDHRQPGVFYALLLLLESCLLGTFAALDVVLFCVFLEAAAIATCLLVGWWGGYERRGLVERVFLFHLASSLLVLFGLVGLVLVHSRMLALAFQVPPIPTFSIEQLVYGVESVPAMLTREVDFGLEAQAYWIHTSGWLFAALLIGFALRTPLVPLHTWYPAANAEAPTTVAVLLSAVSLKCGAYGVLRFVLPLFGDWCALWAPTLVAVAVAGAIYTGLLAVAQHEMKRLLAYVCLSQTALSMAAIFSLNGPGVAGGLLHLVGSGAAVGVGALLIGRWERCFGTTELTGLNGAATVYPRAAALMTVAVLALVGVPGLNGFVGQVLVLLGIFHGVPGQGAAPLAVCGALIAVLLVAWALIAFLQRTYHGRPPHPTTRTDQSDLDGREVAALLPVVVFLFVIGLFPQLLLQRIEPSMTRTLPTATEAAQQASPRRTLFQITPSALAEHRRP